MIAIAIAACEVAFWVLLLAGLTARYVLGRARLSSVLLASVPLVDVVLLAVTAADLGSGGQADWTHGLAAAYLGFTVVFGPSLVAAADRRFARRLSAAVPQPQPRPDRPPASPVAEQWRLWRRCVAACALAAAVLGALVLVAGDPADTRALWAGGGWFAQLGAVCGAWLLLGPAWIAAAQLVHPVPPSREEPT